jgi:hypothetical protein
VRDLPTLVGSTAKHAKRGGEPASNGLMTVRYPARAARQQRSSSSQYNGVGGVDPTYPVEHLSPQDETSTRDDVNITKRVAWPVRFPAPVRDPPKRDRIVCQ